MREILKELATIGKGRRIRMRLKDRRVFDGTVFDKQTSDGPTTFMMRDIQFVIPVSEKLPFDEYLFVLDSDVEGFEVLDA